MRRLLAALLLGLALVGCSTLKFGYNQAPHLGYWWLDSQLSLNDAQSERVRDALQQLQRWHREKELTGYADLLQKLQTLSANDTDAQQVCGIWSQINEGMDRFMAEAVRLGAPVAQQLQARQLRHLARHQEDKNEDWEAEWLQGSADERIKRRLDKAVSRYSDFYGGLNDAQIGLLRTQLQNSVWNPQWGRHERLRRQQSLLAALQKLQQGGLGTAQAEELLQGVWQQWLQPAAGPDRTLFRTFVTQSCQNLADLHNSTSPAQRQRAARRLRAYEADLRELAARP